MTGILPVLELMLTARPLQRWFLWIGASLALAAVAATLSDAHGGATWWTPVAIVGSGVLLFSLPTPASAILLRHLAASRALRLTPRGRIQLLVSGVIMQLLIASIATAWVIAAYLDFERRVPAAGGVTPYSALAAAFVGAFAMATLFFVTTYYTTANRLGSLVLFAYVIILRTLSVSFPHWPTRELITSGTALAAVFTGTWGVWILFGIAFLTGGRITPPAATRGDSLLTQWLAAKDRHAASTPSERSAMRILLTGTYRGHYIVRSLLGIGSGVLCGYCLWAVQGNPALRTGEEKLYAVLTAYVGGVAAAAAIYPMTARARYLWLKACLDRGQLFRTVEAEGWRALLSLSGFTLVICAYFCFLAHVPWGVIVQILLLAFVSGAAMIYLVLVNTRESRLLEGVLVATLSALWLIGMLQSAFAPAVRSWLLPLLALEMLLVPLLRSWAKSRWSDIDWIVNRPAIKQPAI